MSGDQRLVRDLTRDLTDVGLTAWFLARDLATGEEIGCGTDEVVPLASLVKIPLALAVLERIERGELDGSAPVVLEPWDRMLPGGVGVSRFSHPARVALVDAVYLAVSLSDNVAADALFGIVTPDEVDADLRRLGIGDLVVRHPIAELSRTPVEALPDDPDLAQALAARGGTPGGGHRVPQLDVTRASSGTARGLVDLLDLLWTGGDAIAPGAAARLRWLLEQNVHRQRLWPDLASDSATWAAKTGTVLNLRHEAGVVEHADGERFAIAVLTASQVAATVQPAAEAMMGQVARRLRDHLRSRAPRGEE